MVRELKSHILHCTAKNIFKKRNIVDLHCCVQTWVESQPLLLSNCVILNMFLDLSLGYLICKNDTLTIQNEKFFTINPLKFLCS